MLITDPTASFDICRIIQVVYLAVSLQLHHGGIQKRLQAAGFRQCCCTAGPAQHNGVALCLCHPLEPFPHPDLCHFHPDLCPCTLLYLCTHLCSPEGAPHPFPWVPCLCTHLCTYSGLSSHHHDSGAQQHHSQTLSDCHHAFRSRAGMQATSWSRHMHWKQFIKHVQAMHATLADDRYIVPHMYWHNQGRNCKHEAKHPRCVTVSPVSVIQSLRGVHGMSRGRKLS